RRGKGGLVGDGSSEVGSSDLLEEHGQVIRTDIVNMAKDLDDAAPQLAGDPRKFRELMFAQAGLRDLPVAYVVDGKGAIKVAALRSEERRVGKEGRARWSPDS